MQAFQCLESLPHVRSIRGWLLGIARNRCIDRLRAIRRSPRVVTHNELCAIVDASESSGGNDPRVRKALDECLDRLHDKSRAVLILRFCDGLSYNEIATKMSDTAGALRIRLVRALEALRRCLERKGVRP
jgi:RNA polymerase sigma-70 factor (ECF subfamily)